MKNKILFVIFAAFLLLVTAFAASAQAFTITSTPATNAAVGQIYTYQMTASATGITYAKVSGPSGLDVTSSGVVVWTPSAAGTFAVNLSATDNASNVQYQAFNVVVTQTPAKMLEITKVAVKVNGNGDTLTSPGTIDKKAKLGDDVELTITVRNNFASNIASTVLRDVQMDISSDLDDADGLDDSISRLDGGDHDTMTASFTLDPSTVDPSQAPFDITINVQGTTTDGTVYTDSWTISLDMNSNSKDLYIIDSSASPLSFNSCKDNRVKVSASVRNVGTRDLSDAAVRLKISELGVYLMSSGISIDMGDDYDFSDYVTIPKGVAAGVYTLDVDALPLRTTNTVTANAAYDITVLDCPNSTSNTGNTNTGNINTGNENTPTVIVPNVQISGTPVSSAVGKKGLFNSDNSLYLVLLAVLAVLLVTVIVLLAVRIRH